MAQIFGPKANGITQIVLATAAVLAAVAVILLVVLPRSSWATLVGRAPQQPVPFSHQHHVAGLGLDCRYCHTGVEKSAFAGLPPTETCMTCHSQIWTDAELLAPIRDSFTDRQPVAWQRVNNLPDYVFFNHAIHVNNGVGCMSCHGRIDQMPLTARGAPLTMQWCLDCHRDPGPNLRPPEAITLMDWQPDTDRRELAEYLLDAYDIPHADRLTDCYVCHR
ncbi:cytochrome c3 family protein [Paracoccus jeotgali]|uniref:Cytochrome C n=1 Tax=Paracoccus jeotgali TaxID=2065379 RepID=A0A2K9MHB9_9RHOB|nr:cytochrome c3 family protein [Paracoccus jeotgali]AUM75041.1 cytochrome C [Paracoccus jeotgali]